MKKIFNNAGVTLVEVIAAAVILGIIAVPLFSMLFQVIRTTNRSDAELKMGVEAQRIISEIIAQKTTNIPGDFDYSNAAEVYYDLNFVRLANQSNNNLKSYRLKVIVTKNDIQTSEQYDKWDYKINIHMGKDILGNSTGNPTFDIYKNSGSLVTYSGGSTFGGKVYSALPLVLGKTDSPLSLEFIGKKDESTDRYYLKYDNINPLYLFEPKYGSVYTNENTIVVNVERDTDAPDATISALNRTYYKSFSDESTNQLDLDANENYLYHKYVIFNTYNDDTSSPKINIAADSQYVQINRHNNSLNQISNGDKIEVIIEDMDGKVKFRKPTVIGQDL